MGVNPGRILGNKLAHHFVKYCLAQDSIPYWDCMDSNKPSIAVAKNLGLPMFLTM